MTTYDAIVIGSGQGGNPLAYKLADLGWQVALVEKAKLGGTCINTGCTPTKTMVHSALVAHYARDAARWGVRSSAVSVDLAAVVARKNKVVESFRSGLQRKVDERKNLRLYRDHARFTGPRRISAGGEVLESERVFIDTGTRSSIPPIDGLDSVRYLTNASLMELTTLPEHLMVLGGGYIGLEFGQMFRRYGSRVTVVHRESQLLTREDGDIADELKKALAAEGVEFLLNARTARVKESAGQITVELETPERGRFTISGSHLLVATGRVPNTDELDLEKAGEIGRAHV